MHRNSMISGPTVETRKRRVVAPLCHHRSLGELEMHAELLPNAWMTRMTSKSTVYVVDDDEQARASVCALIWSEGMVAQAFPTAEAFLEHHRQGEPGCLVTDVHLPGISGLELHRRLRAAGSRLPVVLITARADGHVHFHCRGSDVVSLVTKPYEHDELWDAISRALHLGAPRT